MPHSFCQGMGFFIVIFELWDFGLVQAIEVYELEI